MNWPTETDIERHRIDEAERDIKRSEDAWMGQRIAKLEAALKTARRQLVTLGGDGSGDHGDKVQRAVLHQIDVALGDD